MPLNQRATYESWDSQCPPTPSHSYFYHLNPLGVGTPYVESLTGYTARLARAHCVRPRRMISKEIAPRINKPYYASDRRSLNAFDTAINGLGVTASNFVVAFEQLTCCTHLSGTTMLPWRNLINDQFLIRRCKAWCPSCYENWLDTGKPIYDPLLWALEVVKICRQHQQWLRLQCPHCNRRIHHLVSRPTPGHCSWCGQFLGIPDGSVLSSQETVSKAEWEWQLWAVRNIEQILAITSHLSSPIPVESFGQLLALQMDKIPVQTMTAFARVISVSNSTVKHWLTGSLPNIKNFLWLCHQLKLTTLQFLSLDKITSASSGPKTEIK
jgi:hypothetical protein